MRRIATICLLLAIIIFSVFAISSPGLAATGNIAKNRAVWHSSSANYNNTGHLVTDGIFKSGTNTASAVVTQKWTDSPVAEEVQYAFDGLSGTKYLAFHPETWVQYEIGRAHV